MFIKIIFRFHNETQRRMISSFKNIAVDKEICSQHPCTVTCIPKDCQHCRFCMDEDDMLDLHLAFQEHSRRGDMQRIFPSKLHYDESYIKKLSPANQFTARWFSKMCKLYKDYC